MGFHYLARGIVVVDGKVLLAHQRGASNTFLPGGHIGSGESAEAALIREIDEEIGMMATVKRFAGAVEASWEEDGQLQHEINLLFEIAIQALDADEAPTSLEPHLEFLWVLPEELPTHNLLPSPVIECLTAWSPDGCFWGSAL